MARFLENAVSGKTATVYGAWRRGPWNGPHLLKIGFSANPKSRLTSLQIGSADEIHMFTIWSGDAAKAARLERALHRLFAWARVRGEWFTANVGDVKQVARLLEADPVAGTALAAAIERYRVAERAANEDTTGGRRASRPERNGLWQMLLAAGFNPDEPDGGIATISAEIERRMVQAFGA